MTNIKNNKNTKTLNQNFAKKVFVQTGKLSALLLKLLLIAGETTIDQMFSPSIYKADFMTFEKLKKLWNEPLFPKLDFKKEEMPKNTKRNSIYTALFRLQKQGLVLNSRGNWSLTQDGENFTKSFFRFHSKHTSQRLPNIDNTKRIVIFDIPEKEREKRDWIRIELLYHEYKPLQKSVWLGRRPLLPQFIENIEFLGLSDCVHIFSVKDEGTIV